MKDTRRKQNHLLKEPEEPREPVTEAERSPSGCKRTDEELRDLRGRYHLLFDRSPEGIVIIDPATARFVEFNETAHRQLGYSREEFARSTILDIEAVESREETLKHIERVVQTGRDDFETVHRTRQGELRNVLVTAQMTKVAGRAVYHCVYRDITEHKRTEEALRESEAFNRRLFESNRTAIVVMDAETARYVDCNPAAVIIYRYGSREEVIGKTPLDVSADIQYDGTPSPEKAIYYIKEARDEGFITFEWFHRRPDGQYWDALVHLMSFELRGHQFLQFSLYDITEQKKTEEALSKARETLEVRVQERTKELQVALETLESEVTHRRQADETLQASLREKEILFEKLRKAHDELELRVRERTAQLQDAYGKLEAEMAERKQVEEQLHQSRKMEAVGTLAGGIAHDFNNILAAIIGFAEMVEEGLPPDSRNFQRLQRVLTAAHRGRDLVQQILAFSRKTGFARKPLPLSPVVKETVQLLRASLPATIEIETKIKARKDAILASASEFQQVLMNLATNAFSAMKDRGGTLGISLANVDFESGSLTLDMDIEPGEYVQLTVTDTGTGMTPEVMKRIFEPFFTTKEVGEGTGMGLAVVYGVVKSLGGTLSVESEPGAGSTFRVFFPVVRTDEKPEGIEVQATPKGSERILFVDDEELIIEWGQEALESLGYEVVALADSMEALKLFSDDPSRFDLVILDETMPKLTGLRLARKLLALRDDIPIILCTGYSDSVSPEKAKEAGVKEFLMKPLGRKTLAEAIRRALNATVEYQI